MSFENTFAKYSVLAVLFGSGVSKLKSFTFEGHTFSANSLRLLADEIKNDKIRVEYDPGMSGKAIYNSTSNTLYVGFMAPSSITRQALIVHEATHAMFDTQAKTMDNAASESLAYIAQCQYARANGESTDPEERLYSEDSAKDRVFEIGWSIAGKILTGGSVESADVTAMRTAVAGHPYYASDASAAAGYDG